MRYDVFISYKRRGSLSLAEKICAHLEREGINVYLDLNRDDSKVAFSEYLLRVIERSKVIICVLGRETLTSEWVHREIRHGYKHKIPMIPIFQESFSTPRKRQKDYIEYLLSYDGVKVFDETGWYYRKALEDITEKVKKFASISPFTQAPVEYPVVFDSPQAPADPSATSDIEPAPSLPETPPQPLPNPKLKCRLTASIIIAVFVFGITGITSIVAINGMIQNTQTAATETAAALLAESSSTPTYTPSKTPTASPTPQPTNTPHPTDTDTLSPTVTPTSTPTRAPSATFTDAPTATYTPAPTLTFTLMPTLTPSIQVIVPPPTETDAPVFLVDPFEVTNKQYKACVQAQKCSPPSNQRRLYDLSFDNEPVVDVSWYMARDYCIYSGGRLPTEDEWITASRHNRGLGGRISEWVGSHDENPEIAITRGNGRDTPERMEHNPQFTSDVIGFRCGRYSSP